MEESLRIFLEQIVSSGTNNVLMDNRKILG